MKRSVMIVIVIGVILGGIVLTKKEPVVYHNTESPVIEEIKQEPDAITKAQQELDRINNDLDIKEKDLLEQRAAIDAELIRLAKTRTSFQ